MCALERPDSITVDTSPFTYYRDTATTIPGGTDTETISLVDIQMTTISESDAIACPSFTTSVLTHDYPGDLTCTSSSCEVKITSDIAVGTYTVTYRAQVASESWLYDWTFQIVIDQKLEWASGNNWVKLVTLDGSEAAYNGVQYRQRREDNEDHYELVTIDTDAPMEFQIFTAELVGIDRTDAVSITGNEIKVDFTQEVWNAWQRDLVICVDALYTEDLSFKIS